MGLLLQNLDRLRKEVEKAQGKVSTATMKEWLGNQKAIKRDCSLDDVAFEEKSAVVIVGISGIGKTTFAQEFLKKHPEFEFCSYDECYYQAARNLNVEGETTAMYIAKLLKNFCSNITRLANGLPVGADIEYADENTLLNAFEGRRKI